MCTVTFIPTRENIVITSNRDENHWRPRAMAPSVLEYPGGKILFPRDPHGGGTWFGVHENGHVLVFLNGAFQKHDPRPPYRKSRGMILLELLKQEEPFDAFQDSNLYQIEPFTGILWLENELLEFRWDGEKKFYRRLDPHHPHIWSSVTLYDPAIMAKRKLWFEDWIHSKPQPAWEDVMHFHQFSGDGDEKNDLLMNRENKIYTMSITNAVICDNQIDMNHLDIQDYKLSRQTLPIQKAITIK